MKILLDHNLDRRLVGSIPGHECSTTQNEGWADVTNGQLLSLAETSGFEVLLTADANIRQQQNLSNRTIAILVLRAYNNRLATHSTMMADVLSELSNIKPGQIIEVFHKDVKVP